MQQRSQNWIFIMCLTALIAHLFSSSTYAQAPAETAAEATQAAVQTPQTLTTEYQYAVKFVCSMMQPHQDSSLAQGVYRTVANVHNPIDERIPFAYKAVLAGRFGDEPSSFSPTPFRGVTLHGDDAAEFNCFNFANLFCPTPEGFCVDFAYIDGFLVIRSPVELDVVGIYTARHRKGDVETMEVEQIPPRKLKTQVRITEKLKDQEIKEHKDYPPSEKPAERRMCGGIAGLPCPKGLNCVDDPSDSCDPKKGGADCPGICVGQMCGGIAGFPCPDGLNCVDDPSDNCDPSKGGADCPGICVSY